MNSKKRLGLICVLCAVLVAVLAVVHFATRTEVPENAIAIEAGENTSYVVMGEQKLSTVEGEVVNGKGETSEVSGEGILLQDLLKDAKAEVTSKVKVISDDEYSAEVEADELEGEKVYLVMEDQTVRMYVFGDPNSKRNVANVKRIVVE